MGKQRGLRPLPRAVDAGVGHEGKVGELGGEGRQVLGSPCQDEAPGDGRDRLDDRSVGGDRVALGGGRDLAQQPAEVGDQLLLEAGVPSSSWRVTTISA